MGGVRILCGPKRSGRPAAFDALIREHWPNAFVIAPTAAYAREAAERIVLSSGDAGSWGKRVATFPQFVDALVASCGEPAVRLGEFERVRVMQRLIDGLAAEGALDEAGASARTPGFRNQALRAIAELKQAAIEPAQFRDALGNPATAAPYHRLLATLYERYQDALHQRGVYDTVGLYWRADVLANEACPPLLDEIGLLALDGFDDFTPSEVRLVRTLARHVNTAAFSLAFDPGDEAQSTLHGLLHGTLGALTQQFPEAAIETFTEPPPETAVHYAARHIFSTEEPPPAAGLRAGVSFVPCGSAQLEREHLARRVKRLLVDDGIPAGAIAVCIPQLDQHLGPLRQAFEAAGIPFRLRDERPVSECGAARFLGDILRAVREWGSDDVLAVLSSPWLDARLGAAGPPHAALIVRKALITGGRKQWADRLAYYRSSLEAAGGTHRDERRYPGVLEATKGLQARFDWLADRAGALANAADEPALASALLDLLMDLEPGAMLFALPDDQRPAETAALRALLEALGRARHRDEAGAIDDAAAWLDDLCVHTPFSRGGAGTGVLITEPGGMRHLSFRRVLFAGLNEGVLPGRHGADPIFSNAERERMRSRGLALESLEHHAQLEMTLFHRVLEAADESLELSWSIADGDGRERFPSPFVQEVRRLLPDAGKCEPIASLFPPPNEAATPREVMACAFSNGAGLKPAARQLDSALFARVQLGGGIESGRHGFDKFDAFDGVLAEPASLEVLSKAYGEDHTWSAAQFQTYTTCPMLFFLRYVLKLEEPEPPMEEIDPRTRGSLVHDALEHFFRDHPTGRLDAMEPGDGPRMDAAVDTAFDDKQGHPELRCVPAGVIAADRARMKEELRRFLRIQSEWRENTGWVAEQFEVEFGRQHSAIGPYPLALEEGVIQVSGIIDRVDRHEGGAARLIDYKTGSLPAQGMMQEGKSLQLGLYAMAWEQHLEPGSACIEAYYLRPGTNESAGALQGKSKPDPEGRREAMLSCIEEIVHSVRGGRFSPIKEKDARLYGFERAVRFDGGRITRKTGIEFDEQD